MSIHALVIPTCRPDVFFDFWDRWKGFTQFDLIVIVLDQIDNSSLVGSTDFYKTAEHPGTVLILSHDQMPFYFSKRDSAIRSYGFLEAYRFGATTITTLDDDCFPQDDITMHHDVMSNGVPVVETSVPGIPVRGQPYITPKPSLPVGLNMGLWSNVPDQDAIHQLSDPAEEYVLPIGHNLLHPGQYVPMCGMNLCFNRELTPLMYFPLMGEGSPYGRFDDIWCGIIAFKIMKHLHLSITYGQPHVFHSKYSDPYTNLVKEAPGIEPNDYLWAFILNMQLSPKESTVVSCYENLIHQLGYFTKFPHDYHEKLTSYMQEWIVNFKDSDKA